MSNGERDFVVVGSARRRRERRLRCFLRHEEMAVRMALARAAHHAVQSHQCTKKSDAAACRDLRRDSCSVTADRVRGSALVIEYIAPAPAVTCAVPSQQLPPVYTTTTVTTDVNLDIVGLVNPQFSITAVEASAPQVVGSLPSYEEFDPPMYNQVHQEQIVAGELCKNR